MRYVLNKYWLHELIKKLTVFLTIATILCGAIKIQIFFTKTMTENDDVIYIRDIASSCDLSVLNTKNLKISDYSLNVNECFVIEDAGYSFSNENEYHLYQKLTSPIIMSSFSALNGTEINYFTLFDALILEHEWTSIGILDNTLDDEVAVNIVHSSEEELEIINKYLRSIYPTHYDLLSNYIIHGSKPVSDAINIGFRYCTSNEDFIEVKSNLPLVELQLNVFKMNDAKYTNISMPKINGFESVKNYENVNAKELYKDISSLDVIDKTQIAEDENSEMLKVKAEFDETYQRIFLTVTRMLIFMTILLIILCVIRTVLYMV